MKINPKCHFLLLFHALESAGCNAQTATHTCVALCSLNIDITSLDAIRLCTERPNCLSVLYIICFVCCRTPVSCGAPWSPWHRPAGWWAVWLKSSQRTTPSTVWPCTCWRLWRPSPLRTDPVKERVVKAPQWTDDKLPSCPLSSWSWRRFYVVFHFMIIRLTHPHNIVVEGNDIHSGYDRLLTFFNPLYFHTCNINYVMKSIVGWICLRWILRNGACLFFVTSPSVSVWKCLRWHVSVWMSCVPYESSVWRFTPLMDKRCIIKKEWTLFLFINADNTVLAVPAHLLFCSPMSSSSHWAHPMQNKEVSQKDRYCFCWHDSFLLVKC